MEFSLANSDSRTDGTKVQSVTDGRPSSGGGAANSSCEQVPVGAVALALRALRIVLVVGALFVSAALSAGVIALFRGRDRARRHLCHRLVAALQRLGPTFIKVGQILQTRRDVLPAALCDELAVLQDSVARLTPAQASNAFRSIYGAALYTVFSEIDEHPIACGSIACVYRARLRDHRQVAVKLQRPGIAVTMAADLLLFRKIGALVGRIPPLSRTPVRAVLDQVSAAVLGQLDMAREAAGLKRLRENLSNVPRVWVPGVFAEASRNRALVMEFIPGLDTGTAATCTEQMRRHFGATTLAAVYRMLFVDGFVHCDLHPGNLYFTRSGFVVVLDAGFSVVLSERIRRLFAEFFLNIGLGAGRRCAELVMASAVDINPDADISGFTLAIERLVERNAGVTAAQFSLMGFATELFDLQSRFGLHAAPEMVFPLLSLLVIEGTVRELDRDVDFQAVARPVLAEGLFGSAH
jgi:ubiquinone biosynthesis protein